VKLKIEVQVKIKVNIKVKVKIKRSLVLTEHYAMKAGEGMNV
jgi:hypothetical protein